MHPRAVSIIATSILAYAVGAACTLSTGGTGDGMPNGQPTVTNPYPSDASDAQQAEDAGTSQSDAPVAQTFQGSPLCSASRSSACYPDDARSCHSATDASGYGSGGGGSFGCRVSPSAGEGVGPACFPASSGTDGDLCRQSSDCAPSYECVGSGVCRLYCCSGNTKCSATAFCDIQPIEASPSVLVPVCMPMHACALLDASTCPTVQTCSVVREDGSTSCVPIGAAQAGDSCDSAHCDRGLACLGAVGQRRCYALCDTSSTGDAGEDSGGSAQAPACPATQTCRGGLPLFPDPSVGVCQ